MPDGDGVLLAGPVGDISASVSVPTSKSLTNRALISACVNDGGRIGDPLDCDDTRFLAKGIERAGWPVAWRDREIVVGKHRPPVEPVTVFLGNSGTGSRLILALLASVPGRYVVDGTPRLRQRPMGPLIKGLEALGASIQATDGDYLPVRIGGRQIKGGQIEISPSVSSQFVTALALVAPLFENGLYMAVEGALPSSPYLDLTVAVLRDFGVVFRVSEDRRSWRIEGGAGPVSSYSVEGDWSAAAFPCAAAAVAGGKVFVESLDADSRQGDRIVLETLQRAGATIRWQGSRLGLGGPVYLPVSANLESCPDTFPALAAIASCRLPGSRFTGLKHLAHKESHRLEVMVSNLRGLGAELEAGDDSFEVVAPVSTVQNRPRQVTAADDHRIAMAMAVTALFAGPLLLDDPMCVNKSFPDFWHQWRLITSRHSEPES